MTKYGYIRVSTDAQATDGTSLASQRVALLAAGVAPDDIYEDAGVSGSVALFERPGGIEMRKALAKGDVIVVTKIDRAFRSMSDFTHTVERLDKEGIGLIVLQIGTEPLLSTPYQRFTLNLFAAFAEFERQLIRTRTKEGRDVRAAQGFYVGGRKPWGHEIVGDGIIQPKDWYEPSVARVKELLAEKRTQREIKEMIGAEFGENISPTVIMKIRDNGSPVQADAGEFM